MKAFIFDLDGVIVDTAKYHFLAWKRIGEKVGFSLTNEQNESLKGISRTESLERILGWAEVRLSEEEKEALLIEKNEDYLQQIEGMGQEEILLVFLIYSTLRKKIRSLFLWVLPVKMLRGFSKSSLLIIYSMLLSTGIVSRLQNPTQKSF